MDFVRANRCENRKKRKTFRVLDFLRRQKNIFYVQKYWHILIEKNKNWRKKSYVMSAPSIIAPMAPHRAAPIRVICAGIGI